MASINLIRIDSRLIHGQVITKWVKKASAEGIVIIDDDLAKDEFMSNIYKMAAPKNIDINMYTVDEVVKLWNDDKMGNNNILVLFKNVDTCYRAHQQGFPIKELQIGGLPNCPGRITVYKAVSFDKQDIDYLHEIEDNGAKIILQITPEESIMSFEKAVQKYKSKGGC